MNVLSAVMDYVFWLSLGIVVAIDVSLALTARQTFSRKARAFGKDIPVAAYVAGLLPTHFWFNFPLVYGFVAGGLLVTGALVVLSWELLTDAPMHPFFAFSVGLPAGMLFFPN